MDERQKKQIFVASLIIFAVVISAVVTILVINNRKLTCEHIKVKPDFNKDNLENLPSKDFKSLVSVGGYLKFESSETTISYEPLNFDSIKLGSGSTSANQLLDMVGECTQLRFVINTAGPLVDSVAQIQVNYTAEAGDSTKNHQVAKCIVEPTGIDYKKGTSYACYSEKKLDCYKVADSKLNPPTPRVKVAQLVINSLQFEVDGDPKVIAEHKFSKPASFCV